MMNSLLLLHSIFAAAMAASHPQACPLLGQQYPVPVQLAGNPSFQAATKNIEATLKATTKSSRLNKTSFSVGMFSTSNSELLYQFHYTDALLANGSHGTRRVDADSIYRIASISKLFTMYMFLLAAEGDRYLNDPITQHVPALVQASPAWNSVTPQWNDITIGDLAGQMGGLAMDFGADDLAPPQGLNADLGSFAKAFPHIPSKEVPKCGYVQPDGAFLACDRNEYIAGLVSESPIFPTAYTPAYSNEAFALVGLALENIAKKNPEAVFNSEIVNALGLTGTSYTVPRITPRTAVIPGNPVEAGWSTDFGVFGPAGGYFSSTNDMAKVGRSILGSQLLSKPQTRRWLKPTSFVESFNQGVGRPWEIYRIKIRGQSIDLYSKSGGWMLYRTALVLIPQYEFGFTILTATNPGTSAGELVRLEFLNEITNAILPVLDMIAREQAVVNFAGHYVDSKTNSSLTVTTDPRNSGLVVSNWINNGVSLFYIFELVDPDLVFRLQPNQIDYGTERVGFTSYYASATPPTNSSALFYGCSGWFAIDEFNYGNIPVGQMVFNLDAAGSATSVELRALRTTLQKQT